MSGSRRAFFRHAALAGAGVLGCPAIVRSATTAATAPDARPRHLIHLVADGTSIGTLTLGDHFSRLHRKTGLRWLDLCRQPAAHTALVNMRSLNSWVTDSAAASSSWSTGSRVVNGVLNQLPDGTNLRPLCSLAAEAGWKRGLVTTTEITHATPAGFAANTDNRGTAEHIALQYLERKIDVLLGGGRKYFEPTRRKDKRDLHAEFARAGYSVLQTASQLAAAPRGQPCLGTFASGHLPFTIDHQASDELRKTVPTLADMTRAALRQLEAAGHFILQVEGGRVDHGAHACDIATAVRDLVAFDDALAICLEFQQRVPDTLLVVTTDHGTANPGLNGTGSGYKETIPLFTNILKATRSFESLEPDLVKNPSAAHLQRLLKEATGYNAPDAKIALVLAAFQKKGQALYSHMNSVEAHLGQLLANHLGVGWTGTSHTADFVPLVAFGPGASRFTGFLQNTDVFRIYTDLAQIDYRNPEAPLLGECQPTADEVETRAAWV
ncbi:MAG TPA: alkaline phosphatase [Verrucomicrobiota bacterium]|nr:alkaline phosphatase [Verrucomicrobiota bacterium]HNU51893.1 alkaline phosphatase [Verrucomicrobiota bacterium]